MFKKAPQPQTRIAQQYTSPQTGSAIRTRVLRNGPTAKMVRGVRVTNSLTLVSNI